VSGFRNDGGVIPDVPRWHVTGDNRALADDVKQLDDSSLAEKISGLDYTVSNLLHGVIEHRRITTAR
jgi:hypothetical protein